MVQETKSNTMRKIHLLGSRFFCLSNYRISDIVLLICTPLVLYMVWHHTVLQDQLENTAINVVLNHHSQMPKLDQTELRSEDLKKLRPIPKVPIGPPLNNTSQSNQNVVIYTPIMETGSTAIRNLLGFLKSKNNFKLFSEPPKKEQSVNIKDDYIKERIVNNLTRVSTPTVFVHSFAFIDFTKYGAEQPIQVSMIREPLERAVALFYRARSPYQVVETYRLFPNVALPTRKYLKKSIEACLDDSSDMECRYLPGKKSNGHTVQFFCGHHPECVKFGSERALKMAIDNVEKKYAVVGVLEMWSKTIAVLERYIPRYFSNASSIFHDKIAGKQSMINRNFYKPSVDEWARREIYSNMTIEEKFYQYVKERLERQYSLLL